MMRSHNGSPKPAKPSDACIKSSGIETVSNSAPNSRCHIADAAVWSGDLDDLPEASAEAQPLPPQLPPQNTKGHSEDFHEATANKPGKLGGPRPEPTDLEEDSEDRVSNLRNQPDHRQQGQKGGLKVASVPDTHRQLSSSSNMPALSTHLLRANRPGRTSSDAMQQQSELQILHQILPTLLLPHYKQSDALKAMAPGSGGWRMLQWPPLTGTQLSPVAPRSKVIPSGQNPSNRHDRRAKTGEGLRCCMCLHTRNRITQKLEDVHAPDNNLTVETRWCQLRNVIQSTTLEVLRRARHQHQDWFEDNDAEIRNLLAVKNGLHKAYIDLWTDATKAAFFRCHCLLQKWLWEMQDNWMVRKAEEIQEYVDRNEIKNFFKAVKGIYGPYI
ncbi:unnamed protein product [Schistocephalus solidus]|uniref:Uncharacterized protein n=1 Tax=Schistocephalus solidus TaxID=70667 RepID=A0A183T411_SCHSO|nr:unnamed protein product [Schistocephalus solidus]